MQNLLENDLKLLLEKDERFVAEGKLLKSNIIDSALNLDKDLLKLLLKNAAIKKHFFEDVEGILVFDKVKFMRFVSNKTFLEDSYTSFKNQIGLASDGEFIKENKEVALVFPYKDCVLEGGQTKEDEKRGEIFWNETLAPDEIDVLLAPKVLTNFKRYDKTGAHKTKADTDFKKENLIIKGNNLLALHSLKRKYSGEVKLIYIDPPYNTGSDTFKYNDSFNHSTWLTFMKNRLEVGKELLSKDGYIFIQIDDNEVAYLKVLADEIFGRENFQTSICVKMSHLSGHKMAHKEKKLPKIKEHILMYAKNDRNVKINPIYTPVSWDSAFDRYNSFIVKGKYADEDCDKWQVITLTEAIKQNVKKPDNEKDVLKFKLENAQLIFRTSVNRSADYSKYPTNKFSIIHKNDGEHYFIYKSEEVNLCSEKIQLIDGKKTPVSILGDIWTDIGINNLSNEGGVSLRFGKKPEKLIGRIIEMTTSENDLVLDFFVGSGTAISAAHKMKRRYIGIEQLDYTETLPLDRLNNVIKGEETGISKTVKWQGGGSFIYCELKQANADFIDSIEKAKTTKELLSIWELMKEKAFISYKVNPAQFQENISEFKKLSMENQKKFLIEVLDKNMLYVNLHDIEDTDFGVSEEDKKLNRQFYKH